MYPYMWAKPQYGSVPHIGLDPHMGYIPHSGVIPKVWVYPQMGVIPNTGVYSHMRVHTKLRVYFRRVVWGWVGRGGLEWAMVTATTTKGWTMTSTHPYFLGFTSIPAHSNGVSPDLLVSLQVGEYPNMRVFPV